MASLVIAFVARRIARRPADARMTFGYGRIEIVAALINYTTLILVGVYLIYEGVMRMIEPVDVAGWTFVILGGVALVVDSLIAFQQESAMHGGRHGYICGGQVLACDERRAGKLRFQLCEGRKHRRKIAVALASRAWLAQPRQRRGQRKGGPIHPAIDLRALRRRFRPKRALVIRDLYAFEADIRGSDPAARIAIRQDRSAPILARIDDWLVYHRARASAKSLLGKALAYIAKYRDGLGRFLTDGRIEIDNNTVERTIRPIALNRKNALFAGHNAGAENWAVIASLIETCKINAVDPHAWLASTLTAIVPGHKQSQIDDLLPWNYTAKV